MNEVYTDLENPHNAPKYKGVYYRYNYERDFWDLYDDFYAGTRCMFSNKGWRLDQCLNKFFEEIKKYRDDNIS